MTEEPMAPRAARGPGWYLKRLSVMGPAEIVHRIGEQWTLHRLRAGHRQPSPPLPASLSFCTAMSAQLPDLPLEAAVIRADAGSLLEGCWPALGFSWRWSTGGDPWRRAPDTGRDWPDAFFGAIAHRAGNPYGDVRVMWEPARLQQLVSLAELSRLEPACATTAIGLLEDELLSFARANAPWSGVHYLSAMECALRILAVCHALDRVRARLPRHAEVMAAAARLVADHARFIAQRLSLHSSAGNHTVAECAGLIYAGVLFPELPGAAAWRERGLALLTTEFSRQVLEDGGGIEQAPWYLLFITDLAGLVVALLEQRRLPVPAPLCERLALARGYLGAFASAPCELPAIGDRDDGYALSPALRLSFGAPDFAAVRTFPVTGQTRVRLPASGIGLVFDHGPLGMAPSCGHGHADALSVCLRRHGRDVLLDPGTFTYTGDASWRAYFRSTAAHNTVGVDGVDQAQQETAFMWSRPYGCSLQRTDSNGRVFRGMAKHDGYAGLPGKVIHWRGLSVTSEGGLLVWDYLDGGGEHDVQLRWHVAGQAIRSGGTWLLAEDMMLITSSEARAFEASAAPLAGWHAERYGQKRPATTIRVGYHGRLPCEFVTRVFPRGSEWPDADWTEDLEMFRAWVRQP